MAPHALSHTFRRNGLYYLRIVVPKALRGLVGKSEFRYSLRTAYHAEACLRAGTITTQVKLYFRALAKGGTALPPLSKDNITDAVELFIRSTIADFQDSWARDTQTKAVESEGCMEGWSAGKYPLAVFSGYRRMRQTFTPSATVEAFLMRTEYTTNRHSLEFHYLLNAIKPIDELLSRYFDAVLAGDEDTARLCRDKLNSFKEWNHALPQQNAATSPEPVETSPRGERTGNPLSEVIEHFKAERKKTWAEDTQAEYTSIFLIFLKIVGDLDCAYINKNVLRAYKQTLGQLPFGWRRMNLYRDLPIQQILKMDYQETVSSDTVNKHLNLISSFMEWATDNGYCEKNVAKGMKIRTTKGDPKNLRHPWSTEELEILFNAKNYPMSGPAHMFWLPVLGLLTGARLAELAQLRFCDIQRVDELWCININDDDGKRIKTVFSKRIVPLHPFIVNDLKFIKFIENLQSVPKAPLFPELRGAKARAGKLASSHFSHFKKRVLRIENDKISFHSLRHTTKKWVDSLILKELWVNDMFGWKNKGTGNAKYGEKTSPSIMYENIVLPMQINVDLSFLKKSSHATGTALLPGKPIKRMKWKI